MSWLRQCPAHHDPGPSLSVGEGHDGQALVRCFAGCPLFPDGTGHLAVVEALRLQSRWLWTPPPAPPETFARAALGHLTFPLMKVKDRGGLAVQGFRHEAFHVYGPGEGRWRKERLRRATDGAKEVRWESRNPAGEWVPGLLGRRETGLPLYLEHDLRPALGAGEPILLVESESSVDTLVRSGHYATTWCGGAGSVHVTTLRRVLLEHQPVVLIPDHDDAGTSAAARIRAALPHAVTLLGELGEDARDLHDRLGRERFRRAVDQALTTNQEHAA